MAKKEITLKDIASSIDNLAVATKKEFEKVDKQFGWVRTELGEIKLRLSNVAYRFELDEAMAMIKSLKRDVDLLKKKVGA